MSRALAVLLSFQFCSCFPQSAESYLAKGKELLYAEEYRLAQHNANKAIAYAKKSSIRNEARFISIESLLLQQERDSALRQLEQFKENLHPEQTAFLYGLAKFQNGDIDALKDFQSLANSSNRDLIFRGDLNYYRGVLFYRQRTASLIEEAIMALRTSIRCFNSDSTLTHIKIANCRAQLADALRAAGQLDEAASESQKALRILQLSPYATPIHFANCYAAEGRIYFDAQRYFKAAGIFEKALKLRLSAKPDSAAIGVTFSNLAACYDLLNDQNSCERAYEQASKYWLTLRNQPNRTIPFANNRALFLQGINESASALRILLDILPVVSKGNIQLQFTTYYNLATLYYDLGDYENTRQYITKASNIPTELLSLSNRVRIRRLHAMLLSKEEKIPEAVLECKKIEKSLSTDEVNKADIASFYSAFADILMSADSFETSKLYLHRARLQHNYTQNVSAQIVNTNALAMVHFQLKKYDSTLFYANRALDQNAMPSKALLYPYRLPMEAIQACFITIAARVKQFEVTNDYNYLTLVYPYEQFGVDLIRAMRKNLYSDADRIYFNNSVAKFYEVIQLVHFYLNQKNDDATSKFFEYVEESKFQALSNSMSAARVQSFKEVNELLISGERQLAKRKVLENNQLIQLLSTSADAEDVEQRRASSLSRLTSLQKNHQSFLDSIRQHFKGYYELKYGGEKLTLSKFQQQLKPSQLILQWKVLDSVILLQGIHRNHVSLHRIRNTDNIHKQIKKLRNQINFKLDQDLISTAQLLYQELLFPVLQEFKKSKVDELIIVPDGFLHRLPFEVLMPKGIPNKYLIESYEVHYAYSCQLMANNQLMNTEKTSDSFLGIAPAFGKTNLTLADNRSVSASASYLNYDEFGFQPLQENESEINLIASLSRVGKTTLLIGDQATEGRIKKMDLIGFKYIHFATHGFVNFGSIVGSGLALTNADGSEDNLLLSSEIYGLSLQADLVCLSACETGLGQDSKGEGLIGLGRAFFYAGCKNLLVSLWKVPDKSTSLFMVDFYQSLLRQRMTIASSLRAAKLNMIRNPEYRSPHFWASFVLLGSK